MANVRQVDGPIGTTSAAGEAIVRAIEEQSWTDRVAVPLQGPLYGVLRDRGALRSILNGTWLGHPVHAAVTDVPVGAWAAGLVLDALDVLGVGALGGRPNLRAASDAAQTVGLAGALGAAVFGLADWSYTAGRARRVGMVHGLLNVGIAAIYGASLVARARHRRGAGVALSTTGFSLLLFSTWLGGELTYRYGVGVNRAAFADEPSGWADVLAAQELGEGSLRRVEAAGTPVLLANVGGRVTAIGNTCTHMGCSLGDGKLDGDTVVCPCHGSRFRVSDGAVVEGPATVPEPAYDVRTRAGRIEVRQPKPSYGMASVGP
jgi:nitrite reductase/ring-hydroxylating ferredoxin subunit/uncharacterized membrane protein